jgi:hypothetical protein
LSEERRLNTSENPSQPKGQSGHRIIQSREG